MTLGRTPALQRIYNYSKAFVHSPLILSLGKSIQFIVLPGTGRGTVWYLTLGGRAVFLTKPHIVGDFQIKERNSGAGHPKEPMSTTKGKIQDLKSGALTSSSIFFLQPFLYNSCSIVSVKIQNTFFWYSVIYPEFSGSTTTV